MENSSWPDSVDLPMLPVLTSLFSYVLDLCREAGKYNYNVSHIADEIDILLCDVKRLVEEQPDTGSSAEFALFAVCAWTDEMILGLSGNDSTMLINEWKDRLLQTRYFNTLNAGYEFFEKLNRLEPDGGLSVEGSFNDKNDYVREVYYTCLALGYRGRYIDVNDEVLLEGLKQSNYRLLRCNMISKLKDDYYGFDVNAEASDNCDLQPNVEQGRDKYFYTVLLFLSVLVYFQYCVFSIVLDVRLNNLLQSIQLW